MIADFLTIAVLQLSVVFSSLFVAATPHTQSGGFQVREPFVHAPDLYAENLDFVSTLVDLPGAKNKRSSWELSYQLYFVPEDKYQEALKRLPRGGSNPPPEFFQGRILLAEGHKKIRRLATLQERTITLTRVPFKQKVPDTQRTKFGVLMTAYSVKIFDAELKNTAYLSGIFLTDPFEWKDQKQVGARKTLYLNFSVSPDGTLNYSQVARTPRAVTRQ
jgi:hypothetical protein